ncbi:MAG: carbonic anhydrase [Bacteroidota bacterium]|nr:carbonic anhydrase [Bacteroidota bacterium]
MPDSQEALKRLKDGNKRFLSGGHSLSALDLERIRGELLEGQHPFAVIVSCSDSRVPPSLVFDQDLGELFVIRVAGNVVGPSQTASVEYAVEMLGTSLVVVLGHTGCGAIAAACRAIMDPEVHYSPSMDMLVSRISEAVENNDAFDAAGTEEEKCRIAGIANVEHAIENLVTYSDIIRSAVEADKVRLVGAEYDMVSGIVRWFDEE